jgi:hypothetical protein
MNLSEIVIYILELFLWLGVLFGLVLDLSACWSLCLRIKTGRGPSPVPVVGATLYMLRIFLRPLDRALEVHRSWSWLAVAALSAVSLHLALQCWIPGLVRRIGRRA